MKYQAIVLCLLIAACDSSNDMALCGRWKMQKVEIFRNSILTKVIEEKNQFWDFQQPGKIKIIDRYGDQKFLKVKRQDSTIRSYTTDGLLKDEFLLRHPGSGRLTLTSYHKRDENDYAIVYYLNKVEDSR
jgi:hypothetical protein